MVVINRFVAKRVNFLNISQVKLDDMKKEAAIRQSSIDCFFHDIQQLPHVNLEIWSVFLFELFINPRNCNSDTD